MLNKDTDKGSTQACNSNEEVSSENSVLHDDGLVDV